VVKETSIKQFRDKAQHLTGCFQDVEKARVAS